MRARVRTRPPRGTHLQIALAACIKCIRVIRRTILRAESSIEVWWRRHQPTVTTARRRHVLLLRQHLRSIELIVIVVLMLCWRRPWRHALNIAVRHRGRARAIARLWRRDVRRRWCMPLIRKRLILHVRHCWPRACLVLHLRLQKQYAFDRACTHL